MLVGTHLKEETVTSAVTDHHPPTAVFSQCNPQQKALILRAVGGGISLFASLLPSQVDVTTRTFLAALLLSPRRAEVIFFADNTGAKFAAR